MSPAAFLLVVGGLVALVAGGKVLVRGASGIARSLGLSPLLIGLTVVALATSAPEMPVAVKRQLVRSDTLFLIAVSVLTLVLSLDGAVTRLDGGILLVWALVHPALAAALGLRHRTSPVGHRGERPTGRALVLRHRPHRRRLATRTLHPR